MVYQLSKELRTQLAELRDTLADLGVTVEQVTTAARDQYDEHNDAWNGATERWQESERGTEVAEWIAAIELVADQSEELGTAIDTVIDSIENLPDRPTS